MAADWMAADWMAADWMAANRMAADSVAVAHRAHADRSYSPMATARDREKIPLSCGCLDQNGLTEVVIAARVAEAALPHGEPGQIIDSADSCQSINGLSNEAFCRSDRHAGNAAIFALNASLKTR
jgi:hypothetical protein